MLHIKIFMGNLGAVYMRAETEPKPDRTLFVPPLHVDFFNGDRISRRDGMIFCPAVLSVESSR